MAEQSTPPFRTPRLPYGALLLLATMLCFITTDANLAQECLQKAASAAELLP